MLRATGIYNDLRCDQLTKLTSNSAKVIKIMAGEKHTMRKAIRKLPIVTVSLLTCISMVADADACFGKKKSDNNHIAEKKTDKDASDTKVDKVASEKKSKKKDKSDKNDKGGDSNRTVRETAGTKVDLVEGMPPFLYWQSTSESPKGMVLCLHELGMHSGVFDDLAKKLVASGYSVYSMDLRGFGGWKDKGSEGKMDLKDTLGDIKSATEAIRKKHPNSKVFLLGEAMGGALALEAASKFSDIISGAISSAPGGEHFGTLGNYLSVGTRFTAFNKRFNKGEELVKVATPKKDLQEALMKDANVRLDLAPNELMACQFYMYKTRQFAKQIKTLPIMIVQGQKDGESRPQGAKKVFDNLSTEDKEFLALENGDHYVFEDIDVDKKAMTATVAWLDKHSAQN